jgi:Ca-activated chloride channel family protein
MNNKFIPTEEQITAWVLNELGPQEAENVEAAVQNDPELQALAEAIRMTVNLSEETFADLHQDETAALAEWQHAEIESAAGTVVPLTPRRSAWSRLVRYSAVAAGLFVMASVFMPALSRSREAALRASPENDRKQYELEQRMLMAESAASQTISQADVDQMRYEHELQKESSAQSPTDEQLPLDESRYGNALEPDGVAEATAEDMEGMAESLELDSSETFGLAEGERKDDANALQKAQPRLKESSIALDSPKPKPKKESTVSLNVPISKVEEDAPAERGENEDQELSDAEARIQASDDLMAASIRKIPDEDVEVMAESSLEIPNPLVQAPEGDHGSGSSAGKQQVPPRSEPTGIKSLTIIQNAPPATPALQSQGQQGQNRPPVNSGARMSRSFETLNPGNSSRPMNRTLGSNLTQGLALNEQVTTVNQNERSQIQAGQSIPLVTVQGGATGRDSFRGFGRVRPSQVASARPTQNAPPTLGDVQLGMTADRIQVADNIQRYNYRPQNPVTPGTEAYDQIIENTFKAVSDHPLSTFSIDVDTASYANMRRFLMNGSLPPVDAVRVEELINYFNYQYAPPTGEHPFSANIEVTSAPWQAHHRLVRVGLKGKEIENEERPPSNLVFLIDVSGSMSSENKLPLVQKALRLLTTQLTANDKVAMVVYAGSSGLVLPSTSANEKSAIYAAIDRLKSGGSTNGGAGIQLAYQVARENFIDGGVNRVILATDGDFNVGVTNRSDLVRNIETNAKSGTFLSVMGFGMGNLKDGTMEQLADKGNGNYAYIDTYREAKKVLVEEMAGTLVTIAKDVKIQVEFNPSKVQSYRLIGYENRALANRDFNDDTKDAGEIGAGHTVTALYEIVPVGAPRVNTGGVDRLRYQKRPQPQERARIAVPEAVSSEMLTVKLRYKQPDGHVSQLVEFNVVDEGLAYTQASTEVKFAAAVASFGQVLRNSPHVQGIDYNMVYELAEAGLENDKHGYRAEFMDLVRQAGQLRGFQMYQPKADTSQLKVLSYRNSGNVPRVQISTGQGRARWYQEGDKFESYEIVYIDQDKGIVQIYSEEANNTITLQLNLLH